MEQYLTISDPTLRKTATALRLSCHKLPIEKGRYYGIIRENRLCEKCKMAVGSEQHVILECFNPKLTIHRNIFLASLKNTINQITKLPRAELLKYILLFADKTIRLLCLQYCHDIVCIYICNKIRLIARTNKFNWICMPFLNINYINVCVFVQTVCI